MEGQTNGDRWSDTRVHSPLTQGTQLWFPEHTVRPWLWTSGSRPPIATVAEHPPTHPGCPRHQVHMQRKHPNSQIQRLGSVNKALPLGYKPGLNFLISTKHYVLFVKTMTFTCFAYVSVCVHRCGDVSHIAQDLNPPASTTLWVLGSKWEPPRLSQYSSKKYLILILAITILFWL